jgi:hypothetical protein
MMIRSDPPGAMVYVDNYPIGNTPVATNYTYYGTREIRLVKDGYETKTVKQAFWPPWYEYPPLDFVVENCVPAEIRDQRTVTFRLERQVIVPADHLRARAERLRGGSLLPDPVPVSQPFVPGSTNGFPGAAPNLRTTPGEIGGQSIHTLPPGGQPVQPVGP